MKQYRVKVEDGSSSIIRLFDDGSWRITDWGGRMVDMADAMFLMPTYYKNLLPEGAI